MCGCGICAKFQTALVQVKFTYELNNELIEQLPGRLSAGNML